MHQQTGVSNIIGMEIGNLKVIDYNRFVKLFAVGVCNRSGSAVCKSKGISGFKILCRYPLIYYPEGMYGSCFYFLTVYEDVDNYIGLFTEGAKDFFILVLARFGVGRVNIVACFDLFDRLVAVFGNYKRTLNKALRCEDIVLDIAVISVCFFFPKLLEIMKNNGVLR